MSFGLARGRRLDTTGVLIDQHDLPPLPDDVVANPAGAWIDLGSLFADASLPVELEIGSGKGTFLVQQASVQRDVNFLGVEWAREFAVYAADRIRRHELANVRMMAVDATELLRWRIPDASLRVIHLYFSDPWPKKRHHKRRVVQDRFLTDAHRTLVDADGGGGGELRIVTDHADYWAWMEQHFDRWCAPEGVNGLRFDRIPFERPGSAGAGEVVGTNFERKYVEEGRSFNATILKKA